MGTDATCEQQRKKFRENTSKVVTNMYTFFSYEQCTRVCRRTIELNVEFAVPSRLYVETVLSD